jgi:hypothetical protein
MARHIPYAPTTDVMTLGEVMKTNLKRRVRVTGAALLLTLGLVVGLVPLIQHPVQAFYPEWHISIFMGTVGSNFDAEAQGYVENGLEASDSMTGHAFYPEWHFDSAKNPAELCQLWMKGPDKLLNDAAFYAVSAIDPQTIVNDPFTAPRFLALSAYGQYLHAIQDFYAHTNWIELHVAAGKVPGLAPIQKACVEKTLQDALPNPQKDKLQSGYFTVRLFNTLPDACGEGPGLPEGFEYCHGPFKIPFPFDVWSKESTLDPKLMLAKDLPDRYHGAQPIIMPDGSTITLKDGTPATYHKMAVQLATLATTETFTVFHDRVVKALGEAVTSKTIPNRDPECLFGVLVKGGDPADCAPAGETRFKGESGEKRLDATLWGLIDVEEWVLKSLSAEITLTTEASATLPRVSKGSLSFVIDHIFPDQLVHRTFVGNIDVGNLGSQGLTSVDDGAVGVIVFSGSLRDEGGVRGTEVTDSWLETFGLALDANALAGKGSLVLCKSASLDTMTPQQQYAECRANPVAELKPVGS